MTQKEARLLILEDITSHFNSNNRSLNTTGHCAYRGINNTMCAAARWMEDPSKAIEGASLYKSVEGLELNDSNHNWSLMKPEAVLAGRLFMIEIQELHDRDHYWDESGLSNTGRIRVDLIKKRYIK